jgi:hypothetical protein
LRTLVQKPNTIREGKASENSLSRRTLLAPKDRFLSPPASRVKQPVNASNDEYEQEAESVSRQVMQMPDRTAQDRTPHRLNGLPAASLTNAYAYPRLQAKAIHFGSPALQATHPSVRNALASTGQPLDASTRSFMEHRFGHDFSKVRIHADQAAGESAEFVGAQAYTTGQRIIFGAGRYVPASDEGRRLLAHELTHVVQQNGRQSSPIIQRKEIAASLAATGAPLQPQDWYSWHRVEWEGASAEGHERELSPNNTFMRAVWYNTLNLKPAEYQTVNERHDYYDLISYVIENDPGTPQAARDVRFFHATTAVTGSPGIGSVDKPIGAIKLGADTRQILREVNADLFAMNMGVIRNLLSNWKEPRDPQTPNGRINAFDFDIRMVETEQGMVEKYIQNNKARFTSSVVGEINDTLDPGKFGQFFNFSQRSFEWAIKALGVSKLDFTIRDHRQAIGIASVYIFHRKSEQDYLTFMKSRIAATKLAP